MRRPQPDEVERAADDHTRLFAHLAKPGVRGALARIDATTRRDPDLATVPEPEAQQQDTVEGIEDQHAADAARLQSGLAHQRSLA